MAGMVRGSDGYSGDVVDGDGGTEVMCVRLLRKKGGMGK